MPTSHDPSDESHLQVGLCHSAAFGSHLNGPLRQPSFYVGALHKADSILEREVWRGSKKGRRVTRDEKGVVSGGRHVQQLLDGRDGVAAEMEKQRERMDRGEEGSKFLYHRAKAKLAYLDKLRVESEEHCKSSAKTSALAEEGDFCMGVSDDFDRNRVLPIVMSPESLSYSLSRGHMGMVGGRQNNAILPPSRAARKHEYEIEKSSVIRGVLAAAEGERMKEKGTRELPYTIRPEPWSRLCPDRAATEDRDALSARVKKRAKVAAPDCETENAASSEGSKSMPKEDSPDAAALSSSSSSSAASATANPGKKSEIPPSCHQTMSFSPVPSAPSPLYAVYNYLHSLNLHVSCGAKFGCDYLVYDGDREDRHAFAGIRIYSDSSLPTAPEITGYVRALNTANKISILVCCKKTQVGWDLAFVDAVLERREIEKFKGKSKRKNMGLNLDKT